MTAEWTLARFPAPDPAVVLSLLWPSRECEPAGVRGGDCMAETGGDGRGDAPPDRLFSRERRGLSSLDGI